MASDWGWSNGVQIDKGSVFNNPDTGQVEAATGQGGVGNPNATAPTANYADPTWSAQDQYNYSLLMSQGRNQEAAALGQQAFKNADTARAQRNAVGASWQHDIAAWNGGGNQAGKYSNGVYNPTNGKWSVYDGKGWSDVDLATFQAGMSDQLKQSRPDWYWGQQEQQAKDDETLKQDNEFLKKQRMGDFTPAAYQAQATQKFGV